MNDPIPNPQYPISNIQVVVLGGAAVDWVARVEALPRKDSIVLARSCERFPGGSAANVAVGLARLGYRVGFVGKLGDDENGRLLLRAFEDEGVDTHAVIVERGRATATCFITVDEHGERMIVALPGSAFIERAEELDLKYLQGARAVYVGPPHTEAVAAAMAAAAHETMALVFYAPGGVHWPGGLVSLSLILEQADVLVVSHTEALALTGCISPEEAAQVLQETGPPVVVQTLGTEGTLVASGARLAWVPAFEVTDVRDTTGAGDAFAAGLIAGFLEGLDWETSARLGSTVAALKIRHIGASSGLPTREEVTGFLMSLQEGIDL